MLFFTSSFSAFFAAFFTSAFRHAKVICVGCAFGKLWMALAAWRWHVLRWLSLLQQVWGFCCSCRGKLCFCSCWLALGDAFLFVIASRFFRACAVVFASRFGLMDFV
ncbi:MAG: hypothetical protein KA994_02780 [Brachymonas sp.]|nr:hypothetical protein [Brachymonas sp.]MBP8746865.1 hypothetical protein [Brachymonas sp.]